ncbi:hypothetical protein SIL87_20030 [Acidiphilium acidophilum]|uniref:Uncharacterized protein n=1 Tax=Acidiphilium acidophilum TaxID=76588 RepID=A0AAW9DUX6_ACIAO|nr:hypothetical protein [Acidiphilium acidophilum]
MIRSISLSSSGDFVAWLFLDVSSLNLAARECRYFFVYRKPNEDRGVGLPQNVKMAPIPRTVRR